MNQPLQGKTVAILVENGFEQIELTEPKQALEQAGAQTQIVSPQEEVVKGWQFTDWGDEFSVDVPLEQANPAQYDALLLPGGVMNPDKLRTNQQALRFVEAFFRDDKPVAAICHGPWTMIDAGVVQGRAMTSYPSIKSDLQNAGARWRDQEVVVDGRLVSSRKPDDLPAFNEAMIDVFASEAAMVGQTSDAPSASFEEGAGAKALGHDSPPVESMHITNEEYHGSSEPR